MIVDSRILRPESTTPLFIAAWEGRVPTREESACEEQWAFETSRSPLNCCFCSRRAGKTRGAVRRHARVLAMAPRGSWTHFGSLIQRNARKHFWTPLKNELERLGWAYKPYERDMILEVLETGNMCQAFGCDDEAGTKAPQGDGSALFTIDECHLPNDPVLRLLISIAQPMLLDGTIELEGGTRGGMMDLLGLPPRFKESVFAEAIDSGGWRCFNWHGFRHDFPKSREEKLAQLIDLCERKKQPIEVVQADGADGRPVIDSGPGTDPEVAWAYFGVRTEDKEARAYHYVREFNDYDPALVDFTQGNWVTGWGIDLGFSDNDAIIIGSFCREDPERKIRVRWQWKRNHLDTFVLADVVRCAREALRPNFVVIDHGGHGATKVAETLGTILRLPVDTKPADVGVSVGLVNDDFRAGRLLLPTQDLHTAQIVAAAERLLAGEPERLAKVKEALYPNDADVAKECGLVLRTLNNRTKKMEIGKRGFHSDLTEALRYCHSALLRVPSAPGDAPKPMHRVMAKNEETERKWREQRDRNNNTLW